MLSLILILIILELVVQLIHCRIKPLIMYIYIVSRRYFEAPDLLAFVQLLLEKVNFVK